MSSQLFEAICARDEERALALCAEPGVVLDVRTGVSPLQAAASRGLVRIAATLLDRGAKLEYASGKTGWIPGGTALHQAINDYRWFNHPWEQPPRIGRAHDSVEIISLLLDAGAKLEVWTKKPALRLTPLLMACRKGHEDLALLLLRKGARPDVACPDELNRTALAYAARNDLPEAVAALVEAGADVNAVMTHDTDQTSTALAEAAKEGAARAIGALLAAGATLEWRDNTGATALFDAVRSGSLEAVRVLLDHGADPDARLKGRLTPRSLAEDPKAWIRGRRKEHSAFHHPADPELRAAIRALFPPSR